jgi:HlyD family secretion protein
MNKPTSKIERVEIEALLGAKISPWRRVLRPGRLALGALLVAAAVGVYVFYFAPASTSGNAIDYVTEPASTARITVRVTATGTVQPTNQVDISSELSGTVREVRVDYNSVVKAGDVLAALDSVKLNATAESSRARLGAAQAELRDAQISLEEKLGTWDRKRKLGVGDVSSAQDRETAKAAYDRAVVAIETAKANILSAQAQLTLDETNLVRARIVSPIDGVVLMRKVDPGQTVASSLQAPILFTIAEDLKRMEVQVDVDEADVGRVKENQPATFSVDAYPDRRFDATIRMVRFGSEVVQGVVTYKAVLTTDNSGLLLRPGMTATAEIIVDEVADALTVSNQALRFTPPQAQPAQPARSLLQRIIPGGRPQFRAPSAPAASGARKVYVLRDGVPVAVPVVTGVSDDKRTQIVKGNLKAGDAVILDRAKKS